MIEAVTFNDFRSFTERAGIVFACAPTLNDVSINNAVSFGLRGNEVVEIRMDPQSLANSRYLPRLRSLALLKCEIGRHRAAAKTARPTLELDRLDEFFALLAADKLDLLDRS